MSKISVQGRHHLGLGGTDCCRSRGCCGAARMAIALAAAPQQTNSRRIGFACHRSHAHVSRDGCIFETYTSYGTRQGSAHTRLQALDLVPRFSLAARAHASNAQMQVIFQNPERYLNPLNRIHTSPKRVPKLGAPCLMPFATPPCAQAGRGRLSSDWAESSWQP